MSIATRITSITNHLEKDYQALESVVGKVSVNKNIENIAPLLDNLWEDLPKTTGSGTSPSISDTRAGKMKLSLKGNTSQNGTPTPDNPIPVNVVSGDNEVVVTGKNLCVSSSKVSNAIISFVPSKAMQKTFTLSFETNETLSGNSMYLYLDGANADAIGYISGSGNITKTITLTDEVYNKIQNATTIEVRIYKNQATFNTPQYAMIVNGSSASDYQPYQSSTYPINLPVENLASLETTGTSIGGVSFTKENGVIHINGTTNSSSNFYFNSFRTKGGTATYWVEVTGYTDKESGNCSIILQQSTDNSTWSLLSDISLKSTATHQASVTLDSSKYYRIRWYTENNTFTNATIKIQLEYGNKKNSFTPYGTTPIEMCDINDNRDKFIRNSGKNLIDMSLATDGKYINSSTGNYGTYTDAMATDYIEVIEGKQYYFSNMKTLNSGNTGAMYDENKGYVSGITSDSDIRPLTIPSGVKYIRLSIWKNNYDDTTSPKPMLAQSSTALPYEPYGNGDWYLEKKSAKTQVSLGGTVYDIGIYKGSICQPPNKAGLYNGTAYCSKSLIATTTEERVENRFYENPANFMFIGSSTDTATTLKEKFDGSDLYYVLATPTYTKIEGTLKDELEAVWRAYSYKGQTNITQSNNDLPFELSITALEG